MAVVSLEVSVSVYGWWREAARHAERAPWEFPMDGFEMDHRTLSVLASVKAEGHFP